MNVFMTNDCYADVCFKRQAKTFVADDILHIFFFIFSEKISPDISCESPAWQTHPQLMLTLISLKNEKNVYTVYVRFISFSRSAMMRKPLISGCKCWFFIHVNISQYWDGHA